MLMAEVLGLALTILSNLTKLVFVIMNCDYILPELAAPT